MFAHTRSLLWRAMLSALVLTACRPGSTDAEPQPAPEAQPTAVDEGSAEAAAEATPTADPAAQHAGIIDNWEDGTLVVYTAMDRVVMEPLLARFTDETGIEVSPVYDTTTALFDLVAEEFDYSPCDVFIGDNQVDLNRLATTVGFLVPLDPLLLNRVDAAWAGRQGRWIGLYGSLMGYAWRTDRASVDELPVHYLDIGQEPWRGRVGWYRRNPTVRWYLAFMRAAEGDAAVEMWVQAMRDNGAIEYDSDEAMYQALIDGDVDVIFALNTDVMALRERWGDEIPVAHHRVEDGGPASMMLATAAGVTRVSDMPRASMRLLEFLTSPDVQHELSELLGVVPLAIDARAAQGIPDRDDLLLPWFDVGSVRPHWDLMSLIEQAENEDTTVP